MSSIKLFQVRLARLASHGAFLFDPTPLKQIALLEEEFEGEIPPGRVVQPCLYKPGALLCQAEVRSDIAAFLSTNNIPHESPQERVGKTLDVWTVPANTNTPLLALQADMEVRGHNCSSDAARRARFILGQGPTGAPLRELISEANASREKPDEAPLAGPDHIFTATPICSLGPASDPRPPHPAVAPNPTGNAGDGVVVAIVDSGMLEDYRTHSWLADVAVDPADIEPLDEDHDHFIDDVAGHGTFVAGVVRTVAPGATLRTKRLLDRAGMIAEQELADQLDRLVDTEPDVINLSLTCQTYTGSTPTAFKSIFDKLGRSDVKTAVVASAGNAGIQTKFWPAADPRVIGVGAVDRDCNVAEFSNYGDWVEVFALGVDVQNAYGTGTLISREPHGHDGPVKTEKRVFRDGLALWSGTSFAAPFVSGLIAANLSRFGGTPKEAAQRVIAGAHEVTRLVHTGDLTYRCLNFPPVIPND